MKRRDVLALANLLKHVAQAHEAAGRSRRVAKRSTRWLRRDGQLQRAGIRRQEEARESHLQLGSRRQGLGIHSWYPSDPKPALAKANALRSAAGE